jgi:hypothetical protein
VYAIKNNLRHFRSYKLSQFKDITQLNFRWRAHVYVALSNQRNDVENPPNCGEENQEFGNPSVGQKTKKMRNCE